VTLRQTLDNGEAEAIALATELQPEVVLLDDKLARRMARRLGVPVTGTLGVLLRAKQVGLVVELRSLITRLQSEGDYYIDPGLIEKALLELESRHDLAENQLIKADVAHVTQRKIRTN
jgi:predicted nucleic acid-binding protein